MIALQVVVVLAVVVVLSLYLYSDGAHRVYDIVISGVVIVATSPIAAVLAIWSAAKNKRVFDTADGLKFTSPDNALKKLPFFYLVFVGKRNILPLRLIGNKKA